MLLNPIQSKKRLVPMLRTSVVLFLVLSLIACALPICPNETTNSLGISSVAWAETTETDDEPDEFQQEIERTAAEYNNAVARVEELDQQITDGEARIAEIEQLLPEQQERALDAIKALYKMQQETPGLTTLILEAESLGDFLSSLEYISRIYQANEDEVNALASMRSELETTQASLIQAREEAAAQQTAAEEALAAAQQAREEAQRKAQEEAARLAAEAAAAAEAEAQAQAQAESEEDAATDSSDAATDSSSSSEESISNEATNDNADWSSDKSTFVAAWASRINSYLAGSPLAGQGETFAAAAWDYGVDPRWSPAISCVESSKGLYCFRSHNAWGWGSSSWDSWEEAIYAHVRGLARGYGYTVSETAAKKYCPPNWVHWYNTCVSEMNKI